MFQPLLTRVQKEDLGPNPPEWTDKITYSINQITDYLKQAFARQITFQDNMQNPIKVMQVVAGTTPESNTVTFSVPLPQSYQPIGLIIINCIDLSGVIVGAAVWAEMQFGLTNGSVTIRAIYGLTATHTYQITFLVF